MSLINDMLKDLDSDKTAEPKEPLPAGLREPEPKRRSPRRLLLPGLAVIAVLYGLVVELNILGVMPDKKPAIEIPKPIALNSKWLQEAPGVAPPPAEPVALGKITLSPPADTPASTSLPTVSNAAGPTAIEPEARTPSSLTAGEADKTGQTAEAVAEDPALEKLLAAAELALDEDRLMTPAGNNAYQFFNSVLLLQADNDRAQAGIEQIRQRYLGWLENALVQGKPAAASQYWQRARSAGTAPEILQDYHRRIEQAGTATAAGLASVNSGPLPVESTSQGVIPAVSSSTITPAAPRNDAAAAVRLQSQGLVVGEMAALRWINDGQSIDQTAVVLADLYAAMGAGEKLANLHQILLTRQSTAAVYAQAQLMARQQNFAGAAEQLANVQFSGMAEQRRMRALAGFYQHLKHFDRALPLYSRLVGVQPANVNDWLGLAVSADAQQMTAVARDAYKNVVQLTHPDTRVMRFAQQRQQDLSFSTNGR